MMPIISQFGVAAATKLSRQKWHIIIIVAYRDSTIRTAGQILVVDDGEIIERGTHQPLLADKGFYYNMYTSQFKGTAVTD